MKRTGIAAACALAGCAGTDPPPPTGDAGPVIGIEEASGVARIGGRLYIVGDHEPGTFYSLPLAGDEANDVSLFPDRLSRHHLAAGAYAMDLEAIDQLADGRIVALSERLSALLDEKGLVAVYGNDLGEFGGRGLEGLSVRALRDGSSRVAVLWEGGYPSPSNLPSSLREHVCDVAAQPTLLIHDLPANAESREVGAGDARRVDLQVPLPAGAEPRAQRFRTPDLVWHRLVEGDETSWGFIVLLSSGWGLEPTADSEEECPKTVDGTPLRWCYKWLQRFTVDGEPFGEPFDLDPVLPGPIRGVNWEGMAWFEPGERLILVYDEKVAERAIVPQKAVIVPLPAGW